ncbi:MAG: SIS domain-containing protein [Candidatus Methanomethylophilaceae archaeon]|nr:SIS domain-containing protein [Candidatus Methanomethylophilaceae archaeon]
MKKANSVIAETKMFQQVVRLPEQIEFSLSSLMFGFRQTSKFAVCGMGTCSIAGEVVSDYMDNTGKSPISVIKGLELPKWVDYDTTAVVISYSGNTKETLHIYQAAVRSGAQVVCITSGGELESMCCKDGNVLMSMPYGFESRGALGYMIGYILVALQCCGLLESYSDFKNVLPLVKQYRDELISSDDNEPFAIAKAIGAKAPVVYSFFSMRSVATRWKAQFNENSKVLSFCGTLPEFNHNELVGWTADEMTSKFIPIVLMDDNASEMLKCMAETPVGMLMEEGMEVYVCHLRGRTHLENTLKSILAGDLTSLYLAYRRNVDAADTEVVNHVKDLL